MTNVITGVAWRYKLAPNVEKDGSRDYTYLPKPQKRTKAQQAAAGRRGAMTRCANAAKITLPDPPWEK